MTEEHGSRGAKTQRGRCGFRLTAPLRTYSFHTDVLCIWQKP